MPIYTRYYVIVNQSRPQDELELLSPLKIYTFGKDVKTIADKTGLSA